MLYDEATEEWYAQRDPDEVERSTILLPYERVQRTIFTYVLFQSPTGSVAAHLESYLLHMHFTSVLYDLYNGATTDQLQLDWIKWRRDYTQNKTWGDSRTSILEALHVNCKF